MVKMDIWGDWEFSPSTKDIINEISLEIESEDVSKLSKDWLALLNFKSDPSDSSLMEVEITQENGKEEDVIIAIKEAISGGFFFPEGKFLGLSVSSISRILSSLASLKEFEFWFFCKTIGSWSYDTLIQLSMNLVVLPKLKENPEASACIIFAMKELATKKPNQFCEGVLIPLLFSNTVPFIDVELLSRVFQVLPNPQKDILILNFAKKSEFTENDWLLLCPLIMGLSQSSLQILLECIHRFSCNFTKSLVFGRFLVNFCKNISVISNQDVLREVIEKHQTLLKAQALKYLELV